MRRKKRIIKIVGKTGEEIILEVNKSSDLGLIITDSPYVIGGFQIELHRAGCFLTDGRAIPKNEGRRIAAYLKKVTTQFPLDVTEEIKSLMRLLKKGAARVEIEMEDEKKLNKKDNT